MSSTTILHSTPASARLARVAVRELCERSDRAVSADHLDTAVLLTSELVSNAVVHAEGPAVLDTALHDGTLRISVTDRSARVPRPQSTAVDTSDSGRGLFLVRELSDRWGWAPTRSGRPGKSVWFELDVA